LFRRLLVQDLLADPVMLTFTANNIQGLKPQ